ncbi:cupin domain-containing protein [Spongiimicrobium sp. 2-473A-2-J]|uniref:cupin domain-containing protein n=1 Tax=Eudoraea algarum TaxID=3417568 RepID=UPI003D362167
MKKSNINKNALYESHLLEDWFSPKIIASLNNEYIKVVKIKGDKVPWHNHENSDKLFYLLEGKLLMEIESSKAFYMNTGDLFVVQKGINHRVSSVDECKIMLIERKDTLVQFYPRLPKP